MSETEEGVIDILISQPRSDRAWEQAVQAMKTRMGWNCTDTIAFLENQIRKNSVVLRTEAVDRAADPKRRAQSWWERV